MKLVEIEFGSELYRKALHLRDEMLRKPIGLQHSEADLEKEPGYRHFGLFIEENLVACLMVVPHGDGLAQIRQMAVWEDLQGKGYGRFLMMAVEPILRASGVGRLFLNARSTAIDFYAKLGYDGVGDSFTEVGIPHLRMEKALAEPS
jgi:predicted GNAT family N-acyltransferase